MKKNTRIGILLGVVAVAALGTLLLPPIAQPQEYHNFADQRRFMGIPNFLDVVSNLAFIVAGVYGLKVLFRPAPGQERRFLDPAEGWGWALVFLSAIAVGFGSAFYHLSPDNARLVWDRLPIALLTMALVSVVVGERISPRAGVRLLLPLLLVGAGSVLYWGWSEGQEAGDLRFYGFVTFLPLVLFPLILLFFPPRYTRGPDYLAALGIYVLSRLGEIFDEAIFAAGNVVSGHTLKHLLAALAIYWLARMLGRRDITNEFRAIPVAKRRRPKVR